MAKTIPLFFHCVLQCLLPRLNQFEEGIFSFYHTGRKSHGFLCIILASSFFLHRFYLRTKISQVQQVLFILVVFLQNMFFSTENLNSSFFPLFLALDSFVEAPVLIARVGGAVLSCSPAHQELIR